jgi:hypothetical protein
MGSSKIITYQRRSKFFEKEILIFDNQKEIQILSNPIAWRIINLLASRPLYTAQIARELGIYEQSAYYYIRKLLLIGAITESGTDFVRGGTARLYRTAFPAYGVEMDWGESLSFVYNQEDWKKKAENLIVRKFLKEFIDQDNKFDGLIIVGSPNPHGIFKTSARDGHYAIQLAFFLGNVCNLPSGFVVKLDEDAKAEKELEDNNLIIIGGPGTNIVSSEFNRFLPIKFNDENYWSGLMDNQGKLYHLDNLGIIAKFKNPFNHDKSIILIAGVRSIGTKSAVIAITNFGEKTFSNYSGNETEWEALVQGYDMDSDGKIDYVDIEEIVKKL